ncbi:uncharacterized protein N7511_004110 [Penicillium nucicola]|uniref:uncharacterized protein n=1 Tax=Penicillium nucicola TaxID=1850975 RepID=UPI00254591CD|nr:uncharacterized protein N7511_004110 [Penicillium nucicola]KAJ5766494.1 hypothetical protein N7511_004110 [Penicillium nucicola]
MVSWLFGGCQAANVPTYFDIRLENNTLTLPRIEEDTSYGRLNGTVVLCLNRPLPVKEIKLHTRGIQYVNWDSTTLDGQHKKEIWREATFYHQIWSFLPESNKKQTTLQPGNYEFPFSITLQNSLPESVAGLDDCYIRYELTAGINCPWGMITRSKDMSVSKAPEPLSFLEPESIERTWAEKIAYRISIPGRAYQLEAPIKIDFRYIPLKKGVRPASMKVQLVESHAVSRARGPRPTRQTREKTILDEFFEFENSLEDMTSTEEVDGEQWSTLSRTILSSSLLEPCMPSCSTSAIKISHRLKVCLKLLNPNGAYSEIAAFFPISFCSLSKDFSSSSALYKEHFTDLQPAPSYTDYIHDRPYPECDVMDILDLQALTGQSEIPGLEYSEDKGFSEDLLGTPCYESAICSGAPRNGGSPCYWDIVSIDG